MSAVERKPVDLVLAGSGHAHVQVLKALGSSPEPGVNLTLVAKEIAAPYSGMLPGYVAGHYTREQIHIDVPRLARFAQARLIHGAVSGIDRARRRVSIAGGPELSYDLMSIDVGITPDTGEIAGAGEHAIAVKPVSTFARRWEEVLARSMRADGPRRIVVAGGGAAGLEIVLAVAHRLRAVAAAAGGDPRAFSFLLVSGTQLLGSHGRLARQLARRALDRRGVGLIEGTAVVEVGAGSCVLGDGRRIAADAVLLATKAAPAAWLRGSGLACTDDGSLALRPTLQLADDDDIFAAGDCATVLDHPRPKAGVFAVRQGPPLTENLRRRVRGEGLVAFVPQERFLTILSLGDKDAIAARASLAVAGGWVWCWKDHIDRAFMARFQGLPQTTARP